MNRLLPTAWLIGSSHGSGSVRISTDRREAANQSRRNPAGKKGHFEATEIVQPPRQQPIKRRESSATSTWNIPMMMF